MTQSDRFRSYQYGEGRTGIGQAVEFSCPSDIGPEEVRKFLLTNIRTIHGPTTGRVQVEHGGYGRYTRYDVIQHKYAAGGSGYIEVLEIKNPPDGRSGFVISELGPEGECFFEWATLEDAMGAFEKFWGSERSKEEFPKLPGFKRSVACGALMPWFYAIGSEELVGDYAFPDGLQDDAVYRFGRQFVVFNKDDIPEVKTCMGTRFIKRKSHYHPYSEERFRLVYWGDGGVWDESRDRGDPPRPLEEGELWITEAVRQFKQLLAGKSTGFEINFTDGNKFVGKLVRTSHRTPCAEGSYNVVAQIKGAKKPLTGWVQNFVPTKDAPDIVQYIIARCALRGQEVTHVEVKESKTAKGGKKWSGVFFQPSR